MFSLDAGVSYGQGALPAAHHKVGYAMNSKSKLERLKAYHEAGHAVMARTLGMAMSYVTMLPTDDMTAGSAMADSASWLARNADQATQLAAIEKDMKSPARMRRRGISRGRPSASQANGLATLSWQKAVRLRRS